MINQTAKFIPNLAEINKPLYDLLHKDMAWNWGDEQQTASKIKDLLCSPEVLAHYDPNLIFYWYPFV